MTQPTPDPRRACGHEQNDDRICYIDPAPNNRLDKRLYLTCTGVESWQTCALRVTAERDEWKDCANTFDDAQLFHRTEAAHFRAQADSLRSRITQLEAERDEAQAFERAQGFQETITTLTTQRDRYKEALEAIANLGNKMSASINGPDQYAVPIARTALEAPTPTERKPE